MLELPPGFKLPFLKDDSYTVQIVNKERHYWRPQLVRNAVPWRFEGVLHEFLSGGRDANGKRILPDHRSQKRLPGLKIRMSEEGARRRTIAADRFRRDAALLEKALAEETDEFLISRYTFYLAQSYHDAGDPLKAVEVYMRRAELGGWDQERYISLYRSANLKAGLGHEAEDVIATYLRAHDICKNRAEALHGAAMFCREKERHQQGYELARRASLIRLPDDALFVETWIYDYGVLDEYAVNAYFAGKFRESRDVCRKLLAVPTLPDTYRSRIKVNLEYAEKAAA